MGMAPLKDGIRSNVRIDFYGNVHKRLRGTDAEERGLPDADDATVLAAMAANSRLLERPLVETDKGVRLCRPQEKVHEIL